MASGDENSTMTVQQFIQKRPYLVWSVKDLNKLSTESIVEHVLNYGNWNDVQEVIKILGVGKASKIFWKQVKKKRCNYRPEIKNYFRFYFHEVQLRETS